MSKIDLFRRRSSYAVLVVHVTVSLRVIYSVTMTMTSTGKINTLWMFRSSRKTLMIHADLFTIRSHTLGMSSASRFQPPRLLFVVSHTLLQRPAHAGKPTKRYIAKNCSVSFQKFLIRSKETDESSQLIVFN
jgi:hypothetical protein